MSEKLLLSRKDATEMVGLSLRSLDYLCAKGDLVTKKVGRRRMILRASLEKFCKSDRSVAITASPARAEQE